MEIEKFYEDEKPMDYFDLPRRDVVERLKMYYPQGKSFDNVLDIGCGTGATGAAIRQNFKVGHYSGVELMDAAAKIAKERLDYVVSVNVETMINEKKFQNLDKKKYDLILILDVIEHLYDPWGLLNFLRDWLSPDGVIVLSIPNAGNIYVVNKLLRDKFLYDEGGLLDKTHIRFFTLKTIQHLAETTGYMIKDTYFKRGSMDLKSKILNILTFGLLKKMFVVQYIVIIK
ncbi:MAG: class I SAM-dependent methyltransferase [Bacteroidetes bacterium]|nr:class I SAM-dependent methyltransferase [Bacteroidota bacterium]